VEGPVSEYNPGCTQTSPCTIVRWVVNKSRVLVPGTPTVQVTSPPVLVPGTSTRPWIKMLLYVVLRVQHSVDCGCASNLCTILLVRVYVILELYRQRGSHDT
jgi:hypothetical protein